MQAFTVHPCPHCGQPYTLEPAYLAQYGGQITTCTRCGQQFILPMPAIQPPAMHPGYGAQPVLGYAAPQYAQGGAAGGLWREGKLLVTPDQSRLPNCCIKCGQPGSGSLYRRTYYWHHPALYLTLLPGILVYVIVALCVRKKGSVEMTLCDRHRSARGWKLLISWLLFLSSFVLWVMAANTNDRDLTPLLVLGGLLAFFVGIIAIALSARMLYPKRIDRGYLWLGGAGEGFLRTLMPGGASGFPVQRGR